MPEPKVSPKEHLERAQNSLARYNSLSPAERAYHLRLATPAHETAHIAVGRFAVCGTLLSTNHAPPHETAYVCARCIKWLAKRVQQSEAE